MNKKVKRLLNLNQLESFYSILILRKDRVRYESDKLKENWLGKLF